MAIRISKYPTKDGKKYYFDIYYPDGARKVRYRSRLFLKKEDAKRAERQFIKDRTEQLSMTDYTFSQMVDKYVNFKGKNWAKSTQNKNEDVLAHIKKGLGDIPLSKLTVSQYEGFLDYLDNLYTPVKRNGKRVKKPYSAGYKNRVIMYLKAICNFAEIHYNIRTRIPFQYDNWKENKQKSFSVLSEEQFILFISNISEPEYKAFFTFLMYTGCRRGEALALQFQDIDFENHKVTINKSFSKVEMKATSTKTVSSIRTIPLSQTALSCCRDMLSLYKTKSWFRDTCFVFGGESPLPFSTIERKKNKALRLSGLPGMRVHDFRHSFITMMISKGADISMVSHYVGHASVKQTLDTYTHFYEDRLESIIKDL